MNKGFYFKLAATNIKKNNKTYIPYMLTCIGTIAMFYIMSSLSQSKGLTKVFRGQTLTSILVMGLFVVGLFAVVFLFYTNSFLVKRRKKEFGVYNILGMEKKHISRVMLIETIYVGLFSLVTGIISGIVLSKLAYLLLVKMLNYKASSSIQLALEFEFSTTALYITIILFTCIFVLTFLNTLRQIHLSNPIQLLRGGQVGEREPKTKWILTILGVLCIGAGYYISLTTKSPLSAIPMFLVAVILVIIGTYCLFIAGSIAILKMLRKNKKYYYKPKHFIGISGMIYRMKQNAVGLANICILSTMVLVMISSTVSLYVGVDDLIRNRYPRNIEVQLDEVSYDNAKKADELIEKTAKEQNIDIKNVLRRRSMEFDLIQKGNTFSETEGDFQVEVLKGLSNIFCIPLSDYNQQTGNNITLEKNEVLLDVKNGNLKGNIINIGDLNFNIKKRVNNVESEYLQLAGVERTYYLVTSDEQTIKDIFTMFSGKDVKPDELHYYYGFDSDSSDSKQISFANMFNDILQENSELDGYTDSAAESKIEFYSLYGGLFFVGIFLGILFIMATVLIIYYKQISEGYDDKERFEIMQNVGMSHSEVKKSIHSQILTVFFLPLVTACIHLAFAFPIISVMLAVFNLTNIVVFIYGMIGTVLVFAVLYAIVYALTAKVYYRIVS